MHAYSTIRESKLRAMLFSAAIMVGASTTANADTNIKVVTSVKPVHSLVASVMAGVGEPRLIVKGASTPHSYSLKPSQAKAIQEADVVFWIGHEMEAFLEDPIKTIGKRARVVELLDAHGVIKLKLREGGAFEAHDHDDDHEHAKEDDHDDHSDHDKHAKTDDHDDHDHADGEFDVHVWLDPANAKAMVHEIAETLAAADPKNAAAYEANADTVTKRLDALVTEVQGRVKSVKGRGFIVFHDAFQYFENRFDLKASGTITVNPEVVPGAARVAEIQKKIRKLGATCVFAEPQFEPKLIKVVTEGSKARSGVLDPLGATLSDGPELYFELIRNLGRNLTDCLGSAS